jgi:class I fructose-bisphosphate aldolase
MTTVLSSSGLRTGRLFRRDSQLSCMVAFDRTLLAGPVAHAIDARRTCEAIVAARPEAVLLSPGVLKSCGDLFADSRAPRVVLRIDYPMVGDFTLAGEEYHRMIATPAQAQAMGADAVVMCLISGYDDPKREADNLESVAEAARQCEAIGLPLIVEAVVWGSREEGRLDAERIARVARIAAELGADLIKAQYTDDPKDMQALVQSCPVPVLVLGGAAMNDDEALARFTRDALNNGARGVIFGRNAWQRESATEGIERLTRIVHGDYRE